ncbi:O-antigen ligase family protein [Citrobacter freundii]|nr:O-antigen ligase family protein [Citrobacter freundii]MBJ7588469.1 O-antigen ligase family protein [Citrobacter freundii]
MSINKLLTLIVSGICFSQVFLEYTIGVLIPAPFILYILSVLALLFLFQLPEIKVFDNKLVLWFIISILIVLVCLLISLYLTDSSGYGFRKLTLFIIYAIVPLIIGFLFGQRFDIKIFLNCALLWSFITLVMLAISPSVSFVDYGFRLLPYYNGEKIDVISYSRQLSLFCLVALAILINSDLKNISIAILITCVILLFSSGSRASLLALILSSLYLFKNKLSLKMMIVIGFIMLLLIYINLEFIQSSNIILRMSNEFGNGNLNGSAGEREELIVFTIDRIMDNPLGGFGIGQFGLDFLGIDIRSYPHNFFLEVYYELGIWSLLPMTFLLSYPYFKSKSSNEFKSFYILTFIYMMFSGDLGSPQYIWFFSGVLWYELCSSKYDKTDFLGR